MESMHSSDEDEGNGLMRDCYELRKRLVATEDSLKNLGNEWEGRDPFLEVDFLTAEIAKVDETLQRERKLRKSIEEKLRESLNAGEEMKEKLLDLKNHFNGEKETDKLSIAEFEMKLALKDAEIHKLQAALTSKAADNFKNEEVDKDHSELEESGLRTEFTAFLERSRLSDRKQQDLERIISHLEDETARYSDEIMILEERLTDKMSYISLMEGKLSQKNSKISFMQEEISRYSERCTKTEKQLQDKDISMQKIEKEMTLYKDRLSECTKQIENFESIVGEKMKHAASLEQALKIKVAEEKQTSHLIEKMNTLNSENCGEMQLQIESLKEQLDLKILANTNLEANLLVMRQEIEMKASLCLDLEKRLDETIFQLEERTINTTSYEQKLQNLNDHLQNETKKVENLEKALSDCKDEIGLILEQAEKTKDDYKIEAEKQRHQLLQVEKEFNSMAEQLQVKANQLIVATGKLDEKNNEIQKQEEQAEELNEARRQIEEEKKEQQKSHLREKENLEKEIHNLKLSVKKLSSNLNVKNKENSELRLNWEETQMKSDLETQKLEELEKLLQNLRSEIETRDSLVNNLQNQLTSVHGELKQAVQDLSQLQEVLSNSEKDIQMKDEQLSVMDRKLNQSHEDILQKDVLLKEQSAKLSHLDKSIKEQKLELKQKSVEVTQLDMSLKEQQSHLQHRLNLTERQLVQNNQELSERISENAEFKAKVELMEEKLNEKSSGISNMEQIIKKQNGKIKEQAQKEADLLQQISILKSQEEKLKYATEELHFAKEEKHQMLLDLKEFQKQIGRKQQIEEDLTRELDECHYLLQSKEADCTRLAKNLGASQVREAEIQAKWSQELQKLKNQFQFKISRQDKEAEKISLEHSKKIAEQEKKIIALQAKIQQTQNENSLLKNDLGRFKERVSEQDDDIKSISYRLEQQQRYSHEIEENTLIKDAEIARLEARMSGYHRSTIGSYGSKLNNSIN